MRTIRNVPEFLASAESSIRSAKPQKQIPHGFLYTFHDLFNEFAMTGHFGLGSETALWGDYLCAVFDYVRKAQPETGRASQRTLDFIGEIYGHAITNGGEANFRHLIDVITIVLGLDDKDLRVVKGETGALVSSRRFERRFHLRVRIPLDHWLMFRDDQLTYNPPQDTD